MGPTRNRFKSHLGDKLVHLHKNLYLNRSDPFFDEKFIRYYAFDAPEEHYRLGQKYERQGAVEKALFHYKASMKKYPSQYYASAAFAIRRLEMKEPPAISENPAIHRNGTLLPRFWTIFLIILLLLNLILLGLFGRDAVSKTISVFRLWGVGKEITYETTDLPYVLFFSYDEPQKDIENELYKKALELAKAHHGQNILIYGVVDGVRNQEKKAVSMTNEVWKKKAFAVAQYNSSLDQTVKIRFLNSDAQKLKPLTEAGANLVRTALETYITDNGAPPDHLEKLLRDYPLNYISFIPIEAQSGSNRIAAKFDGNGGWVFDPSAKQVSEMFYPNIPGASGLQGINFEPIRIVVDKSGHSLRLLSGSTLLLEKKVGVGADDRTPEGTFAVSERVKEPQGTRPNVYGSAALGMGTIAVHGTDTLDSIGGNQSSGCIRMANIDMEELYPLVPKGAKVTISKGNDAGLASVSVTRNLEELFPSAASFPNETVKNKVFHWLG